MIVLNLQLPFLFRLLRSNVIIYFEEYLQLVSINVVSRGGCLITIPSSVRRGSDKLDKIEILANDVKTCII